MMNVQQHGSNNKCTMHKIIYYVESVTTGDTDKCMLTYCNNECLRSYSPFKNV